MKEVDLYPALKAFLEGQGYEVKGEVGRCDVVAVRGDEDPVVVELKLTPNLQLIGQAVDRLALTDIVYVAVPEKSRTLKRERKRLLKLLRMLGLGLITIEPRKERVAVVLDPGPYAGPKVSKKRRERLLGEFARRVGDPNAGGLDRRRGLMTAYRQRALAVARHLQEAGASKASHVAKAVDEPKARDILYRNVYGWFERLGRGVYALSPRGRAELKEWPSPGASGA